MALPYYIHASGLPANQTRALAAQVRDELDQIAASFNLLPIPSAIIGGISNYAVDTGAANAYVISVSPSTITSYVDGLTLRFKATNANTAASTINVNSLGLKSIVRPDGTSLVADDIYAGQICQISYNATTSQFQLALTPLAAVYQAIAYANAAASSAGAAAASATAASGSATSASNSATLASQWATSLVLVDATYYGARKYAIDASASAVAAALSETNAANSASAAAASAVLASQTFTGTSTTSLTVGTGAKTLTTQTGKAWVSGQRITVSRTADPTIVMYALVTSYVSGTGSLGFTVDRVAGTGTYTDWTIGLSGSNGLSASLTPILVTTNTAATAGNYYIFTGNFTLTMPSTPAQGDLIGFGMSRSQTAASVDWNGVNVKGRSAGVMSLLSQNDAAVVEYSGNTTDGWIES